MLKLFYFPGACSLAPHITLEETGVEFTAIKVDLANAAQREDSFLAINTKGRVPALVTPRGTLTENPAILMYLAAAFPERPLAPLDDAFRLAQMMSFNAYLSSTVHVAHAHGPRGARWADNTASLADMKQRVAGNMAECFALIESELLTGPWVMGNDYSVADAYLFTLTTWLKADGVDESAFPNVVAHKANMLQRPAVIRALAREQAAR